jgi:hypothetical protein
MTYPCIVADSDGRIHRELLIGLEGDIDLQTIAAGMTLHQVEGLPHGTGYWDGTALAELTELSAVWDTQIITGSEEATLSGLPIPCTVYVDDTPVVVDDGTFEFSASLGDYTVVVDEVAYLRQEWIIDVN